MVLFIVILSFFVASALSLIIRKRFVAGVASLIASFISVIGAIYICLHVVSQGEYRPFSFTLIDPLSALTVLIITFVGLMTTIYSLPYLNREIDKKIIGPTRFRQYFVLTNLFMAFMLLSVTAANPIAAWIFLEGTTLSTAFLISFYNKPSTIEAAWKYLIINSTGLLLGFFGTLLFFTASAEGGSIVTWETLLQQAQTVDPAIIKIAFVFVLIGFGTKVGLAPMHTWKPDAYSKAPAPIGALLSGALMPVAFTLILKFKHITDAAVGVSFSSQLLISLGILSLVVAALSIFTVRNYKRLLGYSSIEHAGLIALGFGVGGIGMFAAILHTMYHSLIKSGLFYASGNLLLKYNSAHIVGVRGASKVVPVTATLLVIGVLAATGLPPFGLFLTELYIFSRGIAVSPIITIVAIVAVALIFVGFLRHVSRMVFGEQPEEVKEGELNKWLLVPPIVMVLAVLILSFYIPPFIYDLIQASVKEYSL